jgi:hypothetical protein
MHDNLGLSSVRVAKASMASIMERLQDDWGRHVERELVGYAERLHKME